jgi:hypothetical protein
MYARFLEGLRDRARSLQGSMTERPADLVANSRVSNFLDSTLQWIADEAFGVPCLAPTLIGLIPFAVPPPVLRVLTRRALESDGAAGAGGHCISSLLNGDVC